MTRIRSNVKRTYLTATNARSGRSKGMKVDGMTPQQVLRLVRKALKDREQTAHAAAA